MLYINKLKLLLTSLWNKGAFHIFIGNFLTKFVAFFGSIFLVRVLSKQEYGVLGYLENIYSYVTIFAGMGLSNAILRYVVIGTSKEEKFGFFHYALFKGFVFNCLLVVIGIFSSYLFPHPTEYAPYVYLLIFLMLTIPFQDIINDILYNERAMFSNKRFAIFSLIVSSFLVIGRFLGGMYGGLNGIIGSRILLNFLFCLLLLYSAYKKYFSNVKPLPISKDQKKEIDKYSLQYMITNGLWIFFMLNDTFILGRICNPTILADYKVAYVLPGNLAIISSAIGMFVCPYFVKHENENIWICKNYITTNIITFIIVGIPCVLLAIFSKPIITLMYGAQYLNIITLMRFLLVAAFINCGIRFTTANILASMGKVKYNMFVSFIGIILQVYININIIPKYGAIGAAITSIIVYSVMAIALIIFFIYLYFLNNSLKNKILK